jgi:hypothetical protein
MSRGNVVAFLLFATGAFGAELKQATLDAWDQYLHRADARMEERTRGQFLWADESPERARRLRAGEVVVAPLGQAPGHTPEAVPAGLIHHWIGAAFVAGARMDDVMGVVRDYERYTEYYKPSVVDARTLSRRAEEDRFTVVVVNKAMFMKRALDSEYQSSFRQVDAMKWYSVAHTTRVQELSETKRFPDGEGSGYIWRLATISRYQERDGGVYVETEAMALSRPIPMTLHWVVDPIVRRVSRASLETSLEQTREATESVVKAEAGLTAARLHRANIR